MRIPENLRKILIASAVFVTLIATAATTKPFFLWSKGIFTRVNLTEATFSVNGKVLNINGESFPVSKIDSITLSATSPKAPKTVIDFNTSKSNQLTVISMGSNSHSFRIKTSGTDPFLFTNSLSRSLPVDSSVFTFEYRLISDQPIKLKAYFADPVSESRSKILGDLEPTNLWKQASFDVFMEREELEWGKTGNYLRLDPGEIAGITLEIRFMYFRSPNEKELAEREDILASKQYIDNGKVRLGVDMKHGGSVFYFALSKDQKNLLNHFDEGRFIQQSYYGEVDGSRWNGQAWRWNPIQGGGCNGTTSQVRSSEITETSIHVVSIPVHWAYSYLMPELEMEELITLEGDVAHIHYIFRNDSQDATDHPYNSQEMPAVFIDYNYAHMKYYKGNKPWTNDELTDVVPGWPNESHNRTEEWSAYVNNADYGIGVYTPGTFNTTAYRFGNGNSPGERGSDCSYFAPIRQFDIAKGDVIQYDVYVTIGTIEEIRSRFYDIHNRP